MKQNFPIVASGFILLIIVFIAVVCILLNYGIIP